MTDRMKAARQAWWDSNLMRGDPDRRPSLSALAFEAGWDAALKPVSEVKGLVPLVLYFATAEDAAEFVALVREAKPSFEEMAIG